MDEAVKARCMFRIPLQVDNCRPKTVGCYLLVVSAKEVFL